ncbi:MAG: hypothetical protein RL179_20, partial [Planctomycetota bacterium]
TKAPGDDIKFNRSDLPSAEGSHLFNLKDDIGESKNIASANPEKVKALTEAWNQWNKELVKPSWGQQNQKAKKKTN